MKPGTTPPFNNDCVRTAVTVSTPNLCVHGTPAPPSAPAPDRVWFLTIMVSVIVIVILCNDKIISIIIIIIII